MKKNTVNLSVGILMISLLLSGCSAEKDTQDFSMENENMENEERGIIGVVSKSNTSEYWMSVNSGMEAAAAVNSTYLSYLFSQEMGVGFSGYLLNLRIKCAQKLLRESSLKIRQVAEKSGFND